MGINDGIMCPPPPVLGPTFGTSGPSPLLQTIEDLVITDVDDEQRKRMKLFFDKKKQLGELKSEEDFEKMAELGAGNGGVVHCVRHISTGTVIAKKMIHLEVKQGIRKIAKLFKNWLTSGQAGYKETDHHGAENTGRVQLAFHRRLLRGFPQVIWVKPFAVN